MFTSLIALALSVSAADVKCPVMPSHNVDVSKAGMEYAGSKFVFCCGGCDSAFAGDPESYLKKATKANLAVGVGLFNPITGNRTTDKSTHYAVYGGIRYAFDSAEEVTKFNADAKKYTKMPEKESMICAVSGETIADYGVSAGYVDFKGARYYACCAGCLPGLKSDIAELSKNPKVKLTAPKVVTGKNSVPHNHGG